MKLYNTYTNQIEEFKPLIDNTISIYYCGPTVYNYIHVGNARPIIFFDTLRKYFIHRGYKVILASNFTDLNEKILTMSKELGISEMDTANKFIDAYLDDVRSLNAWDGYIKPRVTETIPEIIDFIKILIEKGYAYQSGEDVYFRVSALKEYGALSNRKTDELIQGKRVEVRDEKESGLDFALWKGFHEGITYDSPWGEGRPGWHSECCVMIHKIFGNMIDIHGGGSDLIFPHHENEIAQMEAAYNSRIASFWVHNARVNYGKDKMSKSLGNVIWTKDIENKIAYRMLVLAHPYRNNIAFSEELMNEYNKEFEKVDSARRKLFTYLDVNNLFDENKKGELYNSYIERFDKEMENDMNTPNAITLVYELVKNINLELRGEKNNDKLVELFNTLEEIIKVLGLDTKLDRMDSETKEIYLKWEEARQNKDFAKADEYRSILEKRIKL